MKLQTYRQKRNRFRPQAFEICYGQRALLFVWSRQGLFWFVPKFCTHYMGPILANAQKMHDEKLGKKETFKF